MSAESEDKPRPKRSDQDRPPRKKKKPRARPAPPSPEPVAESEDAALDDPTEVDPSSDGRPLFARGFPADAGLDALLDAFGRGDYARVRRDAPLLAKSTDDDDVRSAAKDLRRRVDPDLVSVVLLAVAVVLLVALTVHYFVHRHVPT